MGSQRSNLAAKEGKSGGEKGLPKSDLLYISRATGERFTVGTIDRHRGGGRNAAKEKSKRPLDQAKRYIGKKED